MKRKRKISSTPGRSQKKIKLCVEPKPKADDRFYHKRTIKCTLGTFCRYKVVQREIEECVFWMSRLQIHSHHVLSMWLTRHGGTIPIGDRVCKKKHKSKDLQGFYNKIMRHLANILQGRTERKDVDEEIRDLCVEYCNETGLEQGSWPEGMTSAWKSRVLEQMARQSATEHKTHLETNLYIYAVRYLRFLIRSEPELNTIRDLPKTEYNKVFSAVCDAFIERETVLHVVKRRPSTLKVFPIKHDIWKKAQQLVERLVSLVPKKTTLSEKSEIMFRILSELEPFAAKLQQKFLNGEEKESRFGKSKWTFDLSPQLDWRPKHIQINTTALRELIKDLAKRHSHFRTILYGLGEVGDETSAYETKYRLWNSLFNLKRVLRAKHPTEIRFGCFMSTDGVSVAATIQKRKSKDECAVENINDEIAWIKYEAASFFAGRLLLNFLTKVVPRGFSYDNTKPLPRKKKHRCHFGVAYLWMKEIDEMLKTLRDDKERLLGGIKVRNDQTLIHKHVKDLAGLEKDEKGIYRSKAKIIGLDPGNKSPATWVTHSRKHQMKHQKWKGDEGEHTEPEERYMKGILKGGEWRFLSGQKQYTRKMNKRMTSFCPEWRNLPSTKTVDPDKLLSAYKQQVAMWDQLKEAFFDDKWFQKQKMRKFCRHQRAMEEVVTRICGTKKKEEQKKVIVAYGDGCKNGNLRGTAPIMSTKLFKKVSQSCCVVVVNEFKTSQLCSCCHSEMPKFQKQYRMKRCTNSDCIRTVWDRDVNASINILNLFLELCHSAKDDGKGQRLEAFTRKN